MLPALKPKTIWLDEEIPSEATNPYYRQHRVHRLLRCARDVNKNKINEIHPPFSLERHPRLPPHSLAQSLSEVAHRDLLRPQDEQDRLPGILGIHVARARQPATLPAMDGGDGSLRAAQAEEPVALFLRKNKTEIPRLRASS